MEPHHETGFPATLCRWVGEIVQSSPEAARLTLLELIVGALLASGGHVTQAILALTPRLGWQAYHWMLERGRFRLLGLISALCRIVRGPSKDWGCGVGQGMTGRVFGWLGIKDGVGFAPGGNRG